MQNKLCFIGKKNRNLFSSTLMNKPRLYKLQALSQSSDSDNGCVVIVHRLWIVPVIEHRAFKLS